MSFFRQKPGLHSFCKGKKKFFSAVNFLWRVQGGFRFPSSPVKGLHRSPGTGRKSAIFAPLVALRAPSCPLEPSKPPITPLKRPLWGRAAPGVEPPPIIPPGNANIMFPIGLAVLDSIRPNWGGFIYQTVSAPGEAGCGVKSAIFARSH